MTLIQYDILSAWHTEVTKILKSTFYFYAVAIKEVCNGGVACSLLKLGSLEKTVTAYLFHSGLHSGTIFCMMSYVI